MTARSSTWTASLSPCSSARAQMPLVRRVRSCSSISLNRSVLRPFSSCSVRTCSSIAARPAYASMQPRRPQVQRAPSISTTTCPISPAPPRPVHGLPSRIRPPPTPVPQNTPSSEPYGRPAPSLNSASVATCTSLPTSTAQPSARFERRRQRERAFPAGQVASAGHVRRHRSCPGEPTPTPPATPAPARPPWRRRAARSPSPRRHPPGRQSVGVGRRAEPSTLWSSSTIAAWILVPPRSIPP